MSEATPYIPGVCNINTKEVAYRRKWRNIGFVSAVVLFAILLIIGANRYVRLVEFLPLFIGMVGYYQTKHRFCVSYAASGLQNAAEDSEKARGVSDKDALVDKAFARHINIKSAAIAAGLTILLVLLPV